MSISVQILWREKLQKYSLYINLRVCDCGKKSSFSVLWLHPFQKDTYLYHELKEGLTASKREHSSAPSYQLRGNKRSGEPGSLYSIARTRSVQYPGDRGVADERENHMP